MGQPHPHLKGKVPILLRKLVNLAIHLALLCLQILALLQSLVQSHGEAAGEGCSEDSGPHWRQRGTRGKGVEEGESYFSFLPRSSSSSLGSSGQAACFSFSRARRSMRCCIMAICASAPSREGEESQYRTVVQGEAGIGTRCPIKGKGRRGQGQNLASRRSAWPLAQD